MDRRIRRPAEGWRSPPGNVRDRDQWPGERDQWAHDRDQWADDRQRRRGREPDDWAEPGGRPPRRGVQVGPLVITPVRVLIVLALAGSIAYLAYAITVRDASSIPLLASGAVVLGLVFAGLAAAGAWSVLEAGRMGADGRAFAMALLGGLCAIAAFGCWGAAVVLMLLSQAAG
ncbi:MAG TPA: hypothetical protein VH813_09760 [Candidatus Limnocylindrales bacterium]|jgi:hypothetical protein